MNWSGICEVFCFFEPNAAQDANAGWEVVGMRGRLSHSWRGGREQTKILFKIIIIVWSYRVKRWDDKKILINQFRHLLIIFYFDVEYCVTCPPKNKPKELSEWIKAENLEVWCHLLGLCDDVPKITVALVIASTSSVSESFPNVVGKAMTWAVPVVDFTYIFLTWIQVDYSPVGYAGQNAKTSG